MEGKTKATVLDSIAAARASDPNIEAFKLGKKTDMQYIYIKFIFKKWYRYVYRRR